MKIDHKSLEYANQNVRNKPPPIPFYVPDNEKKLSPLHYQTYKLRTSLLMGWKTESCISGNWSLRKRDLI
eukprot:5304864-Ditylum_brightwellii.AAC.1